MYYPWGLYKYFWGSIYLINLFIIYGLRWVMSAVKYFLKLEIIPLQGITHGLYPTVT